MNSLLNIYVANIFLLVCYVYLLMFLLINKSFYILMRSSLLISLFLDCICSVLSEILVQFKIWKIISYIFPLKFYSFSTYIWAYQTFWINWDTVVWGSRIVSLHGCPNVSFHCWTGIFPPNEMSVHLSKINWQLMWGCFQTNNSIPLIYMPIFCQ